MTPDQPGSAPSKRVSAKEFNPVVWARQFTGIPVARGYIRDTVSGSIVWGCPHRHRSRIRAGGKNAVAYAEACARRALARRAWENLVALVAPTDAVSSPVEPTADLRSIVERLVAWGAGSGEAINVIERDARLVISKLGPVVKDQEAEHD